LFAGFENVLGALTRFWKKFSEIKKNLGASAQRGRTCVRIVDHLIDN
jgi:hypothetical protein